MSTVEAEVEGGGEVGLACGGDASEGAASATNNSPSNNHNQERHTWDDEADKGRTSPAKDGDFEEDGEKDNQTESGEAGERCQSPRDGSFEADTSSPCEGVEVEVDGAVGGESCKAPPAMHSNSSSETCIPTPSCRICFQGAEQGELLNPCRCDGSVRYTHQSCLLKWISERGCWTCELCCYRFHVIAINTKRPWQWQSITITLVEKVQIIAVFLGSLFLAASISWLLWSALSPGAVWQRRDVLFQICYAMYGFMDLVCVGLIVHEGAAVYSVFMRWRAVNLHWDVQSYNKAKDMEETGTGQSSLSPRTLWLPLVTFGSNIPSNNHHHYPPTTQIDSHTQPWTCLCFTPFCPNMLLPQQRSSLSPDSSGSGEVVVRVTSV